MNTEISNATSLFKVLFQNMESSTLWNSLQDWIIKGEVKSLRRALATSPKAYPLLMNYKDNFGSSSLILAVVNNQPEVCMFLLELNSNLLNTPNTYGWTPLLLACFHQLTPLVRKFVLFPNIQLNAPNVYGFTPLMAAVYRNNIEIIYLLLNAGADVNFRDIGACSSGITPLMLAANLSDRQIVSILLSHGAEINAQNKLNGWTPLQYASSRQNHEDSLSTVQILMEHGADTHIKNNEGKTCIDVAIEIGNDLILECFNIPADEISQMSTSSRLSQNNIKKRRHPIFDAIGQKNRPLLLSLLSTDAKCANFVDKESGFTPLIFATVKGDRTSVKILLDYGARVNELNSFCKWTALMYAVYYGFLDLVKLLMERGADPSLMGNIIEGDNKPNEGDTIAVLSCRDIALMQGDMNILHLLESQPQRKEDKSEFKNLMVKPKIFQKFEKWIRKPFNKQNGEQEIDKPFEDDPLSRSDDSRKSKHLAPADFRNLNDLTPLSAPNRESAFNIPSFDEPQIKSHQHSPSNSSGTFYSRSQGSFKSTDFPPRSLSSSQKSQFFSSILPSESPIITKKQLSKDEGLFTFPPASSAAKSKEHHQLLDFGLSKSLHSSFRSDKDVFALSIAKNRSKFASVNCVEKFLDLLPDGKEIISNNQSILLVPFQQFVSIKSIRGLSDLGIHSEKQKEEIFKLLIDYRQTAMMQRIEDYKNTNE